MAARRIHILGAGNIGLFVASQLRQAKVPVTLLLRPQTLATYPGQISLFVPPHKTIIPDLLAEAVPSYEETDPKSPAESTPQTPIDCLIVAVKSHQVRLALSPLLSRLNKDSTILLLQNGVPPSPTELFPTLEPQQRPHLMAGVVTHGVFQKERWNITLAGKGGLVRVGEAPMSWLFTSSPTTQFLTSSLTSSGSTPISSSELNIKILTKLCINCVINPLTAINNFKNGMVLSICSEDAKAICGEVLKVTGMNIDVLWEEVKRVVDVTRTNWSSMWQDIENGRKTEIRELNGWVVDKAKELGLRERDVRVNKWLLDMVVEMEGKPRERGETEEEGEERRRKVSRRDRGGKGGKRGKGGSKEGMEWRN
ncbi:ketopantoate reductase PanE/ApbA-domain-containing protein [Pyronema domesticum]|nr:ketopantoate reductase PanE/ApbA-domain-containing protein [Pyronema domesticum]